MLPVFLFIHGGFHGAWCWNKLLPHLQPHARQVLTPDFAGSGKEHGELIQSLSRLVEKQAQPVILVGHSSGGMIITELAQRYPEKIQAMVYLAAFLLPENISPPEIMRQDKTSLLPQALQVDPDTHRVSVNPQMAKEVFYADCTDEVGAWAVAHLTSEPQVPQSTSSSSNENSNQLEVKSTPPRFYIETQLDRALSIDIQRQMYQRLPCQKIYSMRTSHSPFLSQPEELTKILLAIHKQVKPLT
ncbi:alpha/beta fold hydrolase [Larkinella knui]|uniref:Alpha/beta fold hydrolase n=1 Tax=Larkinella knui TaxID=2025310 RepID=A0A3P1CB64_9BACT|nr:alpha/beta fold hydrolase [Larkinella knui]RRB10505.1 alpha/beta fold hydrolase [Larkinella knui]